MLMRYEGIKYMVSINWTHVACFFFFENEPLLDFFYPSLASLLTYFMVIFEMNIMPV